MDGSGDHTSKLKKNVPVPQIPVEYDDLYMDQGAFVSQRNYSQDINKKMKMPNRLSVDGKTLHDLEVENMRANIATSTFAAAEMAVPDKITLIGSGTRDPLDDPFQVNGSSSSKSGGYVNITTPPRVLTVDERFPVVDEEEEVIKVETSTIKPDRYGEVKSQTPMELSFAGNNDSVIECPEDKLVFLERKLYQLEQLERQRRTREMVLYPALAAYFLFKIVRWFIRD